MLDHKLDNTVNKESKTKSGNQGQGPMINPDPDTFPSLSDRTQNSFLTDPLESQMADYLGLNDVLDQQSQMSPLNSKYPILPIIPVRSETVREYKKYMQAPVALRETLVKWRMARIKGQFANQDVDLETDWERLQLEFDFLSTLGFYGSLKEKILSPLLNMQVGDWWD